VPGGGVAFRTLGTTVRTAGLQDVVRGTQTRRGLRTGSCYLIVSP
jgi:hypothetical protein